MKKKTFFLLLLLSITIPSFSQIQISSQPHSGIINSSTATTDALYTAGQDGFVIKWNENGQGEHFQVSDLEVRLITVSPDGKNIAIYETDGFSINRISVWNWTTQKRRFAKRITSAVSSLTYSENGTFLMIGITSVDGIIFMDSLKGNVLNKLSDSPGIISFSLTSRTENSSIMYSPLGYIYYSNLRTGERKETLNIETNLTQVALLNNDMILIGVKNNSIYIYNAVNGQLLEKIDSNTPRITTSRNSRDFYYIEIEGKVNVLKQISFNNRDLSFTKVIVKTISVPSKKNIQEIRNINNRLLALISTDGCIFCTDLYPSTEIESVFEVTKKIFDTIFDIEKFNNSFYILTKTKLFLTDYLSHGLTEITDNKGYKNILSYNDDIFFWSKDESKPILLFMNATHSFVELYTPLMPIQAIHLQNETLIIIEGYSEVKLLDLNSKKLNTLYKGSGVQDAVLLSENDLFIAKSSSTSPKSALIHVDVKTHETVMLSVSGEVAYSLSMDPDDKKKQRNIYGVCVFAGTTKKTDIFSYTPESKKYTALLQLNDEDTQAFTVLVNNKLFTNIGKTQVRSMDVTSKNSVKLARYASLATKVCGDENYLLVLNKDGSVSWYDSNTYESFADCYITTENTWITIDN